MKVTIDNQEIYVKEGITILDAAQEHNIYIPHLCSHLELSPYGGCRLCIIEVEGMKGYPTACTTKVEDKMVIRTHTKTLQQMRREILQLILSEHPSACLICDEQEECSSFQQTIRKVGATTGCRWCPKDGDCELQKVVDYLEIDKITFPVYYRQLPIENHEPFYDRDYNLCIYCARCVRICEEHRKSSVISLRQRGRFSTIGPAFNMSHIDAGCEFCGACVSVCPTGALSEKGRKWGGIPDSYNASICPLCDLNCDIQVLIKKGKVIGTLPPGDPHQSGGELCVKGRFCLTHIINSPDRLKEPEYRFDEGIGIVSWDEAVKQAGKMLKDVNGKRVAVYLSPNLTLEEILAAKLFFKDIINTSNITSSILNSNLISYISLSEESISLKEIEKSDCIISVFLNGNYNYAPLTLSIKQKAEKGTPYFQIGWIKDTTSRYAYQQIIPFPGREKTFFNKIAQSIENADNSSPEIKELVKKIKISSNPIFILGPDIMGLTEADGILKIIKKIITLTGSKIFLTNPYSNLIGLLSLIDTKSNEEINELISQKKIDLLYIIGDNPFQKRPPVNSIICQSPFPAPDYLNADLALPSAMWGEISGSFADIKGNIKKFKAVTNPPGKAIQNNEIFDRINKEIGKKDIKFTYKGISKLIPKKLEMRFPFVKRKPLKIKASPPNTSFPLLLIQEKNPHIFYNISLSKNIRDMREIVTEGAIIMNPTDALKMKIQDGDSIFVKSDIYEKIYPVILRKIIPQNFLLLITSSRTFDFNPNPCPVHIRRNNV